MALPAATPIPNLTVIDGGRAPDQERVELENAWVEVEAIAHEMRTFLTFAVEAARRIQVAVAKERPALAGQYAHDLEAAAPLFARRARAAELEAEQQLDQLQPRPIA